MPTFRDSRVGFFHTLQPHFSGTVPGRQYAFLLRGIDCTATTVIVSMSPDGMHEKRNVIVNLKNCFCEHRITKEGKCYQGEQTKTWEKYRKM